MKNYELRIKYYESCFAQFLSIITLMVLSFFSISAQSNDQNFPTPITSNELSGRIPARDLGDARLTTFYYTFDGKQGDVFINVVTTNFNGDIDVFTADNLRPLTKVTAYADSSNNETGRVVYLRQPVKLILRIEGRTPNDDAATFQIKFAGSFAASTAIAEPSIAPAVKSTIDSDVRVNSVGTIIEVKPKPTPTPKEVIAKVEKQPKQKKSETVEEREESKVEPAESIAEKSDVKETEAKEAITKKEPKHKREKTPKIPRKPEAVIKEAEARKKSEKAEAAAKKESDRKAEEEKAEKENATADVKEPKEKKKSDAVKPVPNSALANINLIIEFKDGTKIERPMSEILKFGVDKGILTVISKDGAIGRYSILDVEKMTVQ